MYLVYLLPLLPLLALPFFFRLSAAQSHPDSHSLYTREAEPEAELSLSELIKRDALLDAVDPDLTIRSEAELSTFLERRMEFKLFGKQFDLRQAFPCGSDRCAGRGSMHYPQKGAPGERKYEACKICGCTDGTVEKSFCWYKGHHLTPPKSMKKPVGPGWE